MAGYCTLAQARAAGAAGDDAAVQAAVDEASELVDRYTGDVFEPRTLSVLANVSPDGRVSLGLRVRSVASVTDVASSTTWPTWQLATSADRGGLDELSLPGAGWSGNVLINGWEPYNRASWAARRPAQVRVEGSFGWDSAPTAVRLATAHLAAQLSQAAASSTQSASTTDPEGNVIPVVPPFDQESDDVPDSMQLRTTGSRRADALLTPYKRVRLRAA